MKKLLIVFSALMSVAVVSAYDIQVFNQTGKKIYVTFEYALRQTDSFPTELTSYDSVTVSSEEIVGGIKAYFPEEYSGSFYSNSRRPRYFSSSQMQYEFSIPWDQMGQDIAIYVESDRAGGIRFSTGGVRRFRD